MVHRQKVRKEWFFIQVCQILASLISVLKNNLFWILCLPIFFQRTIRSQISFGLQDAMLGFLLLVFYYLRYLQWTFAIGLRLLFCISYQGNSFGISLTISYHSVMSRFKCPRNYILFFQKNHDLIRKTLEISEIWK